jgi:NitT/TauT family transport system permease protein
MVLSSVLALWYFMGTFSDHLRNILPLPHDVLKALIINFNTILLEGLITFLYSFSGILLAIIFSIISSLIMAKWATIAKLTMPYLVAVKSTPIVAITPILYILMKSETGVRILVSALICYFPIVIGLYSGLVNIKTEHLALSRLAKLSTTKEFWLIRIPSSLPCLLDGLKVAAPLCIIGSVVAEFTGASSGLGNYLLYNVRILNLDLVFASLIILSLESIGLYIAFSIISNIRYIRRIALE